MAEAEAGQAAAEEADIPEWLQRIREKEQKERASQDARDQWQQQALFNGSSKPAPSRHPKHAEEPGEKQAPSEPAVPATEPAVPAVEEDPLEQTPLASVKPQAQPQQPKPAVIIEEEDDFPADESSEDLPDGFVKFDSNSN